MILRGICIHLAQFLGIALLDKENTILAFG
jgi:hypothetical protein